MPTTYNLKPRASPTQRVKGVSLTRRSSVSRFHPYCSECRRSNASNAPVALETGQKLADTLTMPRRDRDASVFVDPSFLMSHRGGQCSRHSRLFSDDCKPSQIKSPEKPTLRPYFEEKSTDTGNSLTSLKRHVSFDDVPLFRNASLLGSNTLRHKYKAGVAVPAASKPTLAPFYRSNGKFYKVLMKLNHPSKKRYLNVNNDTI